MTQFAWHPPVTFSLAASAGALDLTSYVIDWRVKFGCRFSMEEGRFRLLSARGVVTLDPRRLFAPGAPGAMLTERDAATPKILTISMAGETLWQGLVFLKIPYLLGSQTDIVWQLAGRWSPHLRAEAPWRQGSFEQVDSSPVALLGDLLATTFGDVTDINPSRLSIASVDTPALYGQYVSNAGTLARGINRLAWWGCAIPFEDRAGSFGIASIAAGADGRQEEPPDLQSALDGSTMSSVGSLTAWGAIQSEPGLTAQPQVTFGARATKVGDNQALVNRYQAGPNVLRIDWGEPSAGPGTTIDFARLRPHPDALGTGDDAGLDVQLTAVVDVDAVSVGTGVTVTGTPYVISDEGYESHIVNWRDTLAEDTIYQEPPAWTHWDLGPDDMGVDVVSDTTGIEAYVQLLNEAKVEASLIMPLWARSEANRMLSNVTGRSGQLVPGSVSAYGINGELIIDMLTLGVELSGAPGRNPPKMPVARVDGITFSGSGGTRTLVAIAPADTALTPNRPGTSDVYMPPELGFTPLPVMPTPATGLAFTNRWNINLATALAIVGGDGVESVRGLSVSGSLAYFGYKPAPGANIPVPGIMTATLTGSAAVNDVDSSWHAASSGATLLGSAYGNADSTVAPLGDPISSIKNIVNVLSGPNPPPSIPQSHKHEQGSICRLSPTRFLVVGYDLPFVGLYGYLIEQENSVWVVKPSVQFPNSDIIGYAHADLASVSSTEWFICITGSAYQRGQLDVDDMGVTTPSIVAPPNPYNNEHELRRPEPGATLVGIDANTSETIMGLWSLIDGGLVACQYPIQY